MKTKSLLQLLALSLLLALAVAPFNLHAQFYVATNGNDNWSGTLPAPNAGNTDGPFATFGKAQKAMQNSSTKTTYVRAGTYTQGGAPGYSQLAYGDGGSTVYLTSPADNGETWSYYPPDGYNTAILDGQSTVGNSGGSGGNGVGNAFMDVGASNVIVTGLQFERYKYAAFAAWHADNVTFMDNIVHDITSCADVNAGEGAVTITGAPFTGGVIKNNYIYNVAFFGIGIMSFYSSATDPPYNTVASNNVIINSCTWWIGATQGGLGNDQNGADCGAIYLWDVYGYATGISVLNNYIRDVDVSPNGPPGMIAYNGSSCCAFGIYNDGGCSNKTVSGNVITGLKNSCFMNNGGHNNVYTNNICDLGNSVIGTQNILIYTVVGNVPASSATGNIFENNIVIGNISSGGGQGFQGYNSPTVPMTIKNNAYYNYGGSSIYSGDAYPGSTGNPGSDQNPTYENPPFCGGWTYNIVPGGSAFNTPVSFPQAANWGQPGFWGPPGFVIPQTGTPPSYPITACAGSSGYTNICSPPKAPVIDGIAESAWDPIVTDSLKYVVQGSAATLTADKFTANFKALWTDSALYLLVKVTDDSLSNNFTAPNQWNGDAVEVFVDGNNTKSTTYTAGDIGYGFRWNDATVYQESPTAASNPAGVSFKQGAYPGGYLMEIKIAWSALGVTASSGKNIGLDIGVNGHDIGKSGGRIGKLNWHAQTDNDAGNPSLFGTAALSNSCYPSAVVCRPASTPVIDGIAGEWAPMTADTLKNVVQGSAATLTADHFTANYKSTWDNTALYLLVQVTDDSLSNNFPAPNEWNGDAVEVYLDGNNTKSTSYTAGDFSYIFRWNDLTVYQLAPGSSSVTNPAGVSFKQGASAGGYLMEIKIAWSALGVTAAAGKEIGLDVNVEGHDIGKSGGRIGKLNWYAQTDQDYANPSLWGTLYLDGTSCGNVVTTGIEQAAESSGIMVYPNPSTGNVAVDILPSASGSYLLTLYDMTGRAVYSHELKLTANQQQKIILPLENYSSGIYLLNVESNGVMLKRTKLIKE